MKTLVLIMGNWNGMNLNKIPHHNGEIRYNLYHDLHPSMPKRIFRKAIYLSGLKLNYCFYDDWTQYISNPNYQLVFFDATRPYKRLKNVIKHAANKPIIYFWNPVGKSPVEMLKKYFIVYSYSPFDCKKYGLKYNHSFFSTISMAETNDERIIYDATFLGVNKGRLPYLEKIYPFFTKPNFIVLKDKRETLSVFPLRERKDYVKYDDYLKMVVESKAIIDLVPNQMAGDTIRVSEAIQLQKKMITNRKAIKEEFFYNPNNILIIDENTNKDEIMEFLNKPFMPYDEKTKDYFTFGSWLKRFDEAK